MAKALGFSPGQQDAWSKQIERWSASADTAEAGTSIPDEVARAGRPQMLGFPRHLGIHSGGMVICDRPVSEVVPGRVGADGRAAAVLQWDKDDCAAVGLVKFDLLGPGHALRAALRRSTSSREHPASEIELRDAARQEDPAVYDMLLRADSVGVFQVESRAQMATLPRLKPRKFYDLVVEVALIRPGPIQGGSVHPYIRRRNGQETGHLRPPAAASGAGARPSACRCSRSS